VKFRAKYNNCILDLTTLSILVKYIYVTRTKVFALWVVNKVHNFFFCSTPKRVEGFKVDFFYHFLGVANVSPIIWRSISPLHSHSRCTFKRQRTKKGRGRGAEISAYRDPNPKWTKSNRIASSGNETNGNRMKMGIKLIARPLETPWNAFDGCRSTASFDIMHWEKYSRRRSWVLNMAFDVHMRSLNII